VGFLPEAGRREVLLPSGVSSLVSRTPLVLPFVVV
jgi:hypothetical protein